MTASTELDALAASLRESAEPDDDLILTVGCGPLENLVRTHGVELWPQIEHLSRTDPRFRRALSHVWAYDSAEFDRRERLLEELGESRPVTLHFTVYPNDFRDPPTLGWRAWEVAPELPPGQLPRILRAIAERIERDEQQGPASSSDGNVQ